MYILYASNKQKAASFELFGKFYGFAGLVKQHGTALAVAAKVWNAYFRTKMRKHQVIEVQAKLYSKAGSSRSMFSF